MRGDWKIGLREQRQQQPTAKQMQQQRREESESQHCETAPEGACAAALLVGLLSRMPVLLHVHPPR
jgi:hypothetical protein